MHRKIDRIIFLQFPKKYKNVTLDKEIIEMFCMIYRTEGASCNVISEIAAGYKTVCKQKYIYRELASVLEDGSIVPDSFRFPSSCCCHAVFTGNPFTRMGEGIPFTSTKKPTGKK